MTKQDEIREGIKILRPFTGTGAVWFPIGKPPKGTCEFATPRCIKACYAQTTATPCPNYDEEIRIPESEKWEIYKYFVETPLKELKEEIIYELDGLQTPILHWFASGDCMSSDMDKITAIIEYLSDDVVQMGFTRNVELWKRHKNIFALTIEKPQDALNLDKNGMYSIPNYRKQQTVMYVPAHEVRGGYCGPVSCEDLHDHDLDHYIHCRVCRRLHTGCFDRR